MWILNENHSQKSCPEMDQQTCETLGCEKAAKLQCPTCIKLEIKGSYFCSQGPICYPDWIQNVLSIHSENLAYG